MDHSSTDAQQHQETHSSLENMMGNSKTQERMKGRAQAEQALKCPRCDSTNTKFCYYNNYSLSQPRYFCKSCRRYWTQGGTLRNVPVGGGCRKNKRSSSSSSSSSSLSLLSSSSSKRPQDQPISLPTNDNIYNIIVPSSYNSSLASHEHHAPNDFSLAFATLQKQQSCGGFNDFDFSLLGIPNNNNTASASASASGDLLFLRGNSNNSNSHAHVYNGYYSYHDQNNMYYEDQNNMAAAAGGIIEENGDQMRLLAYEQEQEQEQYSNATTTAVTVTTMKQDHELFGGRENNENRILWGGYPIPNWAQNSNANNGDHIHHHSSNIVDFDSTSAGGTGTGTGSGRESWNNGIINASSWHGLLNTPLM